MIAIACVNSAEAWRPKPDMRAALLLLLCAAPAFAQDQGIQKQLIQRQQQTDAFNLQMKQSQEALKASPADRKSLDTRQFSDRQRLDNLSEQQLRDVKQDGQIEPQLRPYERQKADMEREPFRGPVMEVPVRPIPKAEPILPPREGIKLE
jgi:hypothetical protein